MKFLSSGSLSNPQTFPELCVGHTQQNFPELCDLKPICMPLLRFRYARHFSPTLMQEIQLELRHMRRQTKSAIGGFLRSNRCPLGYVAAASPNKPISSLLLDVCCVDSQVLRRVQESSHGIRPLSSRTRSRRPTLQNGRRQQAT